jgi:hypothetical protein
MLQTKQPLFVLRAITKVLYAYTICYYLYPHIVKFKLFATLAALGLVLGDEGVYLLECREL